VVQFHKTEVS